MKRIGAIIPVRLSSERLKQKSLLKICNRPMIYHLLDRILKCKYIKSKQDIVVCTSTEQIDDPLIEICRDYGINLFRGSKTDLIKRFYDAIKYFNFEFILQIDGDDPLTETIYMDECLKKLVNNKNYDVVICEGLPLGLKAFSRKAIEIVKNIYVPAKMTQDLYYFTKTNILNVFKVKPISDGHILNEARLTLDYEEDFNLFQLFLIVYIMRIKYFIFLNWYLFLKIIIIY